jgi:DNA-binding NarL/FixJ family response regulator
MPLDIRDVLAKRGFSPIEIRMIAGVIHGMKISEIAGAFKISPDFVKDILKEIYFKFMVRNRVELVIRLIQMNAFRGFQPRINLTRPLSLVETMAK